MFVDEGIYKKIVFPLRFVSFLVAVLSLIVSLFFLETNHHGNLIFIIILILNYSIWNFSESVAFGHKETKYTSLLNVIFMSLWFIILFFLNDNLFNLYNVLIIFCIINFIKSFIYLFIILTNYYSDKYGCKTVITQNSFIGMNFTYFIIALIGTLSMELPTQFINNNSDSQDVGFYIVGVKLMLPISLGIATIFKAVFPFLIKFYNENKQDFENKIKLSINFILFFGTILATFVSFISELLIVAFFGEDYFIASRVFDFLIWFSVLYIIDIILSGVLSSSFNEKLILKLAIIDIIILVPLFYYFSFLGAVAIAIVKLITGIIFLFYHLHFISKTMKIVFLNKDVIKLSLLFVTISTICLFVENLFVKLAMISTVYLMLLLIDKIFIYKQFEFLKLLKFNNND